ncbi:sensor histidine kinase [Nevskia ramosa]|uniref:sensor histidine kinase n=1 Tax=Nevskia ramosa TaxID=64002 RepID=UPI003D10B8BD
MRILHRLLLSYAALVIIAFAGGALLALAWAKSGTGAWYEIGALGIGGIVISVLGIRFGIVQARATSAPLQKIAAATKAVADGRFDVRIERSSLVEANALADHFNEMATALEAYNSTSIDRLLAEQRRNDVVLGSIDDGLIIIDERAQIERLNPIAARQLGTTMELAIGRTLDELLGGERFDQRIADDIANQTLSQDDEPDLTIGEGLMQRILAIALTPFTDETRPGLVMLLRDVTEEREQEKLRMDFLLRASHELRTPVSGLRMAMDLLAERTAFAPDTREADLFETVHTETKRLADLVGDLLDVSRLSHADTPLKLEAVQLAQLAEDAVSRFEPMALERRLSIVAKVAAGLPELQLDASQFSRVLDNLVGNAIRHTPPGGEVGINVVAGPDAIRIEVRDSGEGMTRRQLTRVFEPFVQFGRNTGGAGLGLTLSREIVERHGGRIEVASQRGQGARFIVNLPWPSA